MSFLIYLNFIYISLKAQKFNTMNPFSHYIRPNSPTRLIQNQYRVKIHQCPNCTCNSQHSQPFMHVLPSSHQNIGQKQGYPPLASPIKAAPTSNIPIINKPKSPQNKFILNSPNSVNIYFNKPQQRKNTNESYSSNNSKSQKLTINTNRLFSLNQNEQIGRLIRENRPNSPQMSVNIKPNVSIRYLSPSTKFVGKAEQKQETLTNPYMLNSKQSLFTFGEAKRPAILKNKKSILKRLNSQSKLEQTKRLNFHNQIISKQDVSNLLQQSYKPKPAIIENKNSVKQYFSAVKNNKQPYQPRKVAIPKSEPQTTAYTTVYPDFSTDQVNVSPQKDDQQYEYSYAEEINKKSNHHIFEEGQISDILGQQVKLNYDYFGKKQMTDQSISKDILS